MKKCCMCQRIIESDDAPLLAMGAVGNPKLLCEDCSNLIDTATMGDDVDRIEAAMDKIGAIMADGNPDRVTFNIVSSLMVKAAARGKAIKNGEYDFSLDEAEGEDEYLLEDIPEELLETEEDRELDRKDEEKIQKFDKIYNVIVTIACVILAGMVAWKLIERFLL